MVTAAVVGASGFIGSAVCKVLHHAGVDVVRVPAPRVRCDASTVDEVMRAASRSWTAQDQLRPKLEGADVVINTAGVGQAVSGDNAQLVGANALLPCVIAYAAAACGISRLVHVSSAAVQGRRACLDESFVVEPFSPYSRSKALGERAVRHPSAASLEAVIFRPTSVHGRDRGVSRNLARLARGPWASVAGDGSAPSPQVLVENVAAAIAFVAASPSVPAPIVLQPSEGLTTRSVLVALGDREPRQVPAALARAVVRTTGLTGRLNARVAGHSRRLEMLWLGQDQATGWLERQGWRPPAGYERWRALGAELASG